MKDIYVLTGEQMDYLFQLAQDKDRIYKISVAIDGGFKIKINEYTWSPPLGEPLERT